MAATICGLQRKRLQVYGSQEAGTECKVRHAGAGAGASGAAGPRPRNISRWPLKVALLMGDVAQTFWHFKNFARPHTRTRTSSDWASLVLVLVLCLKVTLNGFKGFGFRVVPRFPPTWPQHAKLPRAQVSLLPSHVCSGQHSCGWVSLWGRVLVNNFGTVTNFSISQQLLGIFGYISASLMRVCRWWMTFVGQIFALDWGDLKKILLLFLYTFSPCRFLVPFPLIWGSSFPDPLLLIQAILFFYYYASLMPDPSFWFCD